MSRVEPELLLFRPSLVLSLSLPLSLHQDLPVLLSFLQLVYSSNERAGVFLYTNDLMVLVDVLVRGLVDRAVDDPVLEGMGRGGERGGRVASGSLISVDLCHCSLFAAAAGECQADCPHRGPQRLSRQRHPPRLRAGVCLAFYLSSSFPLSLPLSHRLPHPTLSDPWPGWWRTRRRRWTPGCARPASTPSMPSTPFAS